MSAVLGVFLTPASAFYKWQGDGANIDLRGMLQIYGTAYRYPENTVFYQDRNRSGLGGLARLIMKAQIGDNLSLEADAYQTYIPEVLLTGQTALMLRSRMWKEVRHWNGV